MAEHNPRWDTRIKGISLPKNIADGTWDFRQIYDMGFRFVIVETNYQKDPNWAFYYNENFANVIDKIYRDTEGKMVIIGQHNINEHWISTSGASLAQWQDPYFIVDKLYPEQDLLLKQVKNKYMQGLIFNYTKWWLDFPPSFSRIVPGAWGSAIILKTMEQYLNNAKIINPRIKNAYPMYYYSLVNSPNGHQVAGGTLYTNPWREAVDYNVLGTINYTTVGENMPLPPRVAWPDKDPADLKNLPPMSANEMSFWKYAYAVNIPGLNGSVGLVVSDFTEGQFYNEMGVAIPSTDPPEEPPVIDPPEEPPVVDPPEEPPVVDPPQPSELSERIIEAFENIADALEEIANELED